MGRYFYRHRPYLFPMPFCKNQAERQETMKIKIRYENEYQTLEVENMELEKWLNSSISEEIRKIEKGNDSYKYDNVATQEDFDKF